jgi:hypothetical protein
MFRLAALTAAVALTAYACTPPQPDLTALSPRARFDTWVSSHTAPAIHETIGWASGYYNPLTLTVHYDDTLVAAWETRDPGMGEWVTVHEEAHAVGFALGLFIHLDDPTLPVEPCSFTEGCPSAERAAQAITEVVLGHGPEWTDDPAGYWDAPTDIVDSTRLAMIALGAW